jgi:hypothetical protein
LSGPSSAQRAIELDDRGQLLALQCGQIEFASKETALRIQHLEVAVETSLVPVCRQPSGVVQGRHELLLLRGWVVADSYAGWPGSRQTVAGPKEVRADRAIAVDELPGDSQLAVVSLSRT